MSQPENISIQNSPESSTTVGSEPTLKLRDRSRENQRDGQHVEKALDGRMTTKQARALCCGDVVQGAASRTFYLFRESQDQNVIRVNKNLRTRVLKLWVEHFSKEAFDSEDGKIYGIGHVAFKDRIIKPILYIDAVGDRFMTMQQARQIKVGDIVRTNRKSASEGERSYIVRNIHEIERHNRGVYKLEFTLSSIMYTDLMTRVGHRDIKEVLRYPDQPWDVPDKHGVPDINEDK